MENAGILALPARKQKSGKVSVQTFMEKYYRREDGCRYEYQDGVVIKSRCKTPYTMNDYQQYIANNLTRFFSRLEMEGKVKGILVAEKDNWLTATKYRVPDLCYMSPKDEFEAAEGKRVVTEFAIEIVTPNDTADYYDEKLEVYFQAGMKVVWVIYPKTEKVKIYQADQSSITCRGDEICSGAPVLPEFALAAKDIFKKPPKPA